MAERLFAFGDDKVQGIVCPARESGFNKRGHWVVVAEHYDDVVRERYGIDEGVIPESVARSCWNEALQQLKEDSRAGYSDSGMDCVIHSGEVIREEVFG